MADFIVHGVNEKGWRLGQVGVRRLAEMLPSVVQRFRVPEYGGVIALPYVRTSGAVGGPVRQNCRRRAWVEGTMQLEPT